MHVRVTQAHQLVADLPAWEGELPAVGDYLYHPPQLNQRSDPEDLDQIAGCVIQRVWRMYERPARRLAGEPEGFRQTHHPYVEIVLGS